MSSTLIAQYAGSVPADEADTRTTITVVAPDSESAEATHAPDFNTAEHDIDTEGGLTSRAVADYYHPKVKYAPPVGNANTDFTAEVDSTISTKGTAAERELAGQFGHGTMPYAESIEPTIREGGAFDNIYFAAGKTPVQDGTMDYMTAARFADDQTAANMQSSSAAATKAATQADLLQRFLEARIG